MALLVAVMRTQGSLRLILNTKLWAQMQIDKASEKSIRITAMDTEDQGVKVFLISVSSHPDRLGCLNPNRPPSLDQDSNPELPQEGSFLARAGSHHTAMGSTQHCSESMALESKEASKGTHPQSERQECHCHLRTGPATGSGSTWRGGPRAVGALVWVPG